MAFAYLAAAWAALTTALVCALLPMGMPQSRPTGSAFDPASITVTLNPAAQDPRAAERRTLKRQGREPWAGFALCHAAISLPMGSTLLRASAAAVVPPLACTVAFIMPGEPRVALGPRAPPAA